MSYDVVSVTLVSAVANAATFTAPYPAGKTLGHYQGGFGHKVSSKLGLWTDPKEVSFSFGAGQATITNNSGYTIPAGTVVNVQFDRVGADATPLADESTMAVVRTVHIDLGSPAAAAANAISASQSVGATAAALLNGATAGVLDVPRNVVAAWTGTAVLTVTGLDAYGKVVVEASASGTSFTGKKAFKSITSAVFGSAVTAATIGTGDVLGLPVFLPKTGRVLKELQDGAAPTAGTVVAGVRTTATATTGDVRGTYDPNAACDGSKAFALIVALDALGEKGVAQFAG